MASSRAATSGQDYGVVSAKDETTGAGISWPDVFTGAFTVGALTLILAVLGAGIDLSSVSRAWKTVSFDLSQKIAVADIDKDRVRNARVLKKTAGLT